MDYTGKLKKKIPPLEQVLPGGESLEGFREWVHDRQERQKERIGKERLAKLPDLFEAHGVEVNDWQALAIALACEFVPGFQIGNGPGTRTQRTKWSKFDKALFRYAVETTVAKAPTRLMTTRAIQRVAALPYWKEKTAGKKPGALRGHYDKAPKELVQWMLEGPPEPFDWLFSVN